MHFIYLELYMYTELHTVLFQAVVL